MEIVAKDDLRKRVPPRLYDFHAWYRVEDRGNVDPNNPLHNRQGVVSWHRFNYQKDYCQSQFGYTCQRPATSSNGADGTGKSYTVKINILNTIRVFSIKTCKLHLHQHSYSVQRLFFRISFFC